MHCLVCFTVFNLPYNKVNIVRIMSRIILRFLFRWTGFVCFVLLSMAFLFVRTQRENAPCTALFILTPWHTIYSLYYLKTKGKKKKKCQYTEKENKFVRGDKTSWLLDRCTRTTYKLHTHRLSDNAV